MKENVTFGECFSDILHTLNIKSSKLARELNIDASLVYKWLRSERIPPVDSPYIELFIGYLAKKPLNPQQKMDLTEIISRYGINLSGTNDAEILGKLELLLRNVQRQAIRLRDLSKSMKKDNIVETETKERFRDCLSRNDSACCYDSVKIIKGNENVIASMIDLLKNTPRTPSDNNNTILLKISHDIKFKDGNLMTQAWMQELYALLKGGWKLILHIVLDDNVLRTKPIIESILTLLTTENLSAYYHLKAPNEVFRGTELCVIPGIGALLCFSTYKKKMIDSAFLFQSKDSLELLSAKFFQNLNLAEPLFKSYPHQKTFAFQQIIAEYEEMPGDKYVFKRGLSTATIPPDLYHKYLEYAKLPDTHFSYRTFLHKRRLDAFEKHVQHYNFRDICFWESLIQLVENGKRPFDEEYLFADRAPQKKDIIRHLEFLIELLEKHDNYNIAFVSMSQFESLYNMNCLAKGDSCVLIVIENETGFADGLYSKMNYSITEKSTVHAFQNYFNDVWDNIPDELKNKKNTITQLKSLIIKLSYMKD